MLRSISGTIAFRGETFVEINVHGVGFKAHMNARSLSRLPSLGKEVKIFTHLHVREDALDLYAFTTFEELGFFENLLSVSGVGPKSALAILDVAELDALLAAIKEGRPDLLSRASGIGKKTAERIILELKNKVQMSKAGTVVQKMDEDSELVDALVGLGYPRHKATEALSQVKKETQKLEDRLKEALRILSGKK